jgi:HEXXH motif-containing protein
VVPHPYQLLGAHYGSIDLTPTARTYQAYYGATTPAAAAARHLEQLKLFAAGLALRTGATWTCEQPLRLTGPVAIPGTRLWLDGERSAALHGVRGSQPLTNTDVAAWQECPLIRRGNCEIRLQAALFCLPSVGYGRPLQEAGAEFQREQAPQLGLALAAIERYAPQQFEQVAAHMQVVALKPANLGDYSNVSHSELPGACVLALLDDPVIMADRLIHELHHNRLFCLEEKGGALFDEDRLDSVRDARFYSPWRDEPRPLHGLLHAFYVFQPVWRFWQSVREAQTESEQTLAFADDQLRRIPRQLELAADILRRHGEFTPYGQSIFEGMCRGAEEIADRAAKLPGDDPPAWLVNAQGALVRQRSRFTGQPITVHAAVEEHIRCYEAAHGNRFPGVHPAGRQCVAA